MTRTSYLPPGEQIRESVQQSLEQMRLYDLNVVIETEMVMDQWRTNIFDGHVYAWANTRYQILARRIPTTRRYLVALHDKNQDTIYAASLESGAIQALAAKARSLVPPNTRFELNPNWRG